MKHRTPLFFALLMTGTIFAASTLTLKPALAVHLFADLSCTELPSYSELTQVLRNIVTVGDPSTNSGLANHMWATVVTQNGVVCEVTASSDNQPAELLSKDR